MKASGRNATTMWNNKTYHGYEKCRRWLRTIHFDAAYIGSAAGPDLRKGPGAWVNGKQRIAGAKQPPI